MDKNQARQSITELFTNAFDGERYQLFLRNLLNHYEACDGHYTGNYIPDAFKEHVKQYWRVGKYVDPEGGQLDLLVVQVKTLNKLERARSALRNFSVNRLKQFEKEASLVAFYAEDDQGADWRFSFIKIEHEAYQDDKGKIKLKQELTPAKRYSYLVGQHENSHTASKQLLPLLEMDYADPKVEDIEAAFSIEKVTGEFFDQYKALFQKLAEHLKRQPSFKVGNEEKRDQRVSRFAKKLLGQIVFLYFLQKKGWLGVAKHGHWGEGSKRFMRDRFDQVINDGGNYYGDFLQYLFYEALADERKDQDDPGYYARFDCRVPFLNGGLFEADYDWRKDTIDLPNGLFHNDERSKNGEVGTGILDVFDRYNFTIKEDEPLEKEVAVDPEMLGKVFENMLEVTERKSKGAYYTPREIVHYMCQESLIHYLDNSLNKYATAQELAESQADIFGNPQGHQSLGGEEVKVPRSDLETLICKGHFALENDTRVLNKGKETRDYRFQLPETVRDNANAIDKILADIKVCDPAIGSGAFPVGLLHEIVNARLALAPHSGNGHSAYELKRHAIAESIYGVDIDASAIDIARLRLWLSLIVDEEDYSNIEALPNLDYKIVQGDSIVGFPQDWNSPAFQQIEELKKDFFNETDYERKAELKSEIDAEIQRRLDRSTEIFGYRVNFDFRFFFSEVWHQKGGFDIVIGNPPYIDSEQMTKEDLSETRNIVNKTMRLTKGNWDIYIAFFEKGVQLQNGASFLIYISPDKWLSKPFGNALRADRLNYFSLITEAGRKVFKEAKVDSVITGISSRKHQMLTVSIFKDGKVRSAKMIDKGALSPPYALDFLFSEYLDLITKIEALPGKLKVLAECENACATSDAYKLKEFIKDGVGVNVEGEKRLMVVNTGTVGKYKFRWGVSEMTYLKDKYLRPYVDKKEFLEAFRNTYGQRAIRPKIIIKGLTLLDASLDMRGHVVPGKSTLVILEENIKVLRYILLLTNSSIAFFYIKERYRGSSYNQGINFTKDMINAMPIPLENDFLDSRSPTILSDYMMMPEGQLGRLRNAYFFQLIDGIFYELYFPEEIKAASKEILSNLGDLTPIADDMTDEEKLAVIQREFDRLYDPSHPVRNHLETLDSVEVVRTIREALQRKR